MKTDISNTEWLKIKNRGIRKYIMFQWIIPVALPLSIVLPILRAIVNRDFSQFISTCIINFCVLCTVSILFGIRKWRKYIKMFS